VFVIAAANCIAVSRTDFALQRGWNSQVFLDIRETTSIPVAANACGLLLSDQKFSLD
jgi:orotate phosphoribosyltransferase